MLDDRSGLYEADHVLTVSEFCEIARHPMISTDRLARNMKDVSRGVQMIVYQMHERCDGSGYPRGSVASGIHPLAKIAAVADAYVALISPRPHRPALLPYYAIKKMLEDVADRLFDSTAVRALLYTISLFPLGSFVELNNRWSERRSVPTDRPTIGRSSKFGADGNLTRLPYSSISSSRHSASSRSRSPTWGNPDCLEKVVQAAKSPFASLPFISVTPCGQAPGCIAFEESGFFARDDCV